MSEIFGENSLVARILKTIYSIRDIKAKQGLNTKVFLGEIAYVLWNLYYRYENRSLDDVRRIVWSYVSGKRGRRTLRRLGLNWSDFIKAEKEGRNIFFVANPYVCFKGTREEVARIIASSDPKFYESVSAILMGYSVVLYAIILDSALMYSKIEQAISIIRKYRDFEYPLRSPREILQRIKDLSLYLKEKFRETTLTLDKIAQHADRMMKIIDSPSRDLMIQAIKYEVMRNNILMDPASILQIDIPPISLLAMLVSFIFYGSIHTNIMIIKRYFKVLERILGESLDEIKNILSRIIDTVKQFLFRDNSPSDIIYAILVAPESRRINLDDPGVILWLYALTNDLPKYASEIRLPITTNADLLESILKLNIRTLRILQEIDEIISTANSPVKRFLKRKIDEGREILVRRILVLYSYLKYSANRELQVESEIIANLKNSLQSKILVRLLECLIKNNRDCVRKIIKDRALKKSLRKLTKFWGKIQDDLEYICALRLLSSVS